jgi:acetyl-CoA acetyltransferase
MTGVAIAGVGLAEPGGERLSHAELLYRATRAALDDAGLRREAITSAVTTSYDYVEGRPLSNQFTLDSIGGVMKPCDLRLGDDALHSLAAGVMEALADPGGVVVVAAVLLAASEHSDETVDKVQELSYEPVWTRPIVAGSHRPEALVFGLIAQEYMGAHHVSEEDLADLVSRRSSAGPAAPRSADEILESPVLAGPLREGHLAPMRDVAAALLLSTDPPSGRVRARVRGVGFAAYDALLGPRRLGEDYATAKAAEQAYRRAGIEDPTTGIDRVVAANAYGIDEVLACEALGLAPRGGGMELMRDGNGPRISVDGGSQGHGWARGTSSLAHTVRAIDDMDGGVLVAQGWTGCGGSSAAVAVMEVAA